MKLMIVSMRYKQSWDLTGEAEDKKKEEEEAKASMLSFLKENGFSKFGNDWGREYIVRDDILLRVVGEIGINPPEKKDVQFWIESVRVYADFGDPLGAAQAICERLELAANRLANHRGIPEDLPGFNHKTNSPISGNHLHNMDILMLCEDYCTDALQERLSEGWRIIAVCPQEQRRPDYVLGKVSGMDEKPYQAKRG